MIWHWSKIDKKHSENTIKAIHASSAKFQSANSFTGFNLQKYIIPTGKEVCVALFENHCYTETSSSRNLQGNKCKLQTYSKYEPHLIALISGLIWGVPSNAFHTKYAQNINSPSLCTCWWYAVHKSCSHWDFITGSYQVNVNECTLLQLDAEMLSVSCAKPFWP